ncbi:MAG: hypothetical protein QM640_17230 [Niabella sp.]
MKKALPYILGVLLAVAIIYQFFGRNKRGKKVSTYISLNKRDKNPYGSYVFFESLKTFFPKAAFKINYNQPGDAKVFGGIEPDQLYVILQPEFDPSDSDFDDLVTFIDRGNNVFISAFSVNKEVEKFVKAKASLYNFMFYPFGENGEDTMHEFLNTPPFTKETRFHYPGTAMEGFFTKVNDSITKVLGKSNRNEPNFIHLKKGDGNLYIQLCPLVFSNYFLLYKNNIRYFEQVFSQFPASTSLVIWDEYFNYPSGKEKGWFRSIMKNPYFSAGIITALLLLLIYTLTETRRRQRAIPVMEKPVNDSLEFVKTMGLLYYEKGDHRNLSQKISTYFLENVRSRYKIFANKTDDTFIKELSDKSGADKQLVSNIVYSIQRINNEGLVSDRELLELQNNIETFYNKI